MTTLYGVRQETPHADFYHLKGLVASSHPELLELITEAERRYCLYDTLTMDACADATHREIEQEQVKHVTSADVLRQHGILQARIAHLEEALVTIANSEYEEKEAHPSDYLWLWCRSEDVARNALAKVQP